MECRHCGTSNRVGRRFCGGCGAPLVAVCAACGFANEADALFCGGCGGPVGGEAGAPAVAGERRLVTVLFADVVGFTPLSESLGPEAIHEIMDACLVTLTREVERFGGRVTGFTGDGIMALFGAPLAEEDHAIRAVHAALGIQDALVVYGNSIEERFATPFRMRIGLNSGLVVAGGIGDGQLVEYTALGDTINLAARLEQAAPPGGILAGMATQRAAAYAFEWRAVGPLTVKGKAEPVTAYEPTGPGAVRGRSDALTQRELTRFVGRQHEFDQVVRAWERTTDGRGQVISVVGEAGLGKSRLLHEFKELLLEQGAVFYEGSCFTYGDTVSYLPFIQILRGILGLDALSGESEARRAVTERLRDRSLGIDLARFLVNVLGFGDAGLANQSSASVRVRTLDAFRSLILAEASTTPMTVVVEDVHWIDKASEEVLSVIVEAMADIALLVVLVYRPEYLRSWTTKAYHAEISLDGLGGASTAAMVRAVLGKSYAERVALGQLSAEDSRAMVHQLLGTTALPAELETLIATTTEGNPLFIEELTRELLETGELVHTGDGYVFARPPETLTLPSTVQAVLMARVDRLKPEIRSLLQVASVLGRVFRYDLVAAVAGTERVVLDEALLQLEELDFVYATSLGPDREYSFKHVLAQEAVYQTLLQSRRQAYHRRTGQAIERLYEDRLEEFYEVLAHHFERGADEDKAIEYADLAAGKALRANAMAEAKHHFEVAEELLGRAAQTPANLRRRVAMMIDQHLVWWQLYQLPEWFDRGEEHLPMAETLDDPALLGRLLICLGHCQWVFGDCDRAQLYLGRATDLCEAVGDSGGAGMAYANIGWMHLTLGHLDEVQTWLAKARRAFEEDFDPHYYMWTRTGSAWAHTLRGAWDQAVAEAGAALRVGEQLGDNSITCFSAFMLCITYTDQGLVDDAVAYGELALHKAPTPADRVWSQMFLAAAWTRAGRAHEAITVLPELTPATDAVRFAMGAVINRVYLGEAYWQAGRLDEARDILQAGLDRADRAGMAFWSGRAHRLLGEVANAEATPAGHDRARHHLEESLRLLTAARADNEAALAYDGCSRLSAALGELAAADRYRSAALEIFRRLGTVVQADRR